MNPQGIEWNVLSLKNPEDHSGEFFGRDFGQGLVLLWPVLLWPILGQQENGKKTKKQH